MTIIEKRITFKTEEEADTYSKGFLDKYPVQGYDTKINKIHRIEGNYWVLEINRQDSCD